MPTIAQLRQIDEMFREGLGPTIIARRIGLKPMLVENMLMRSERWAAYRRLVREGNPFAVAHGKQMRRNGQVMGRVAALAVIFLPLAAFGAQAAPPAGADPNSPTARWYRSLTIPGTDYSCCNDADCRQTAARFVGGAWEAHTPDGDWVPVPANRIIKDKVHPGGSAVLCFLAGRVMCFVPPQAGG